MRIAKDFTYSMVVISNIIDEDMINYLNNNTDGAVRVYYDNGMQIIEAWLEQECYQRLYVMVMNKEEPFEKCYVSFKNVTNWKETPLEHREATVSYFKATQQDKY